MHVYICTRVHIHSHTHTHTHTNHMRSYMHTCTHTHTHTKQTHACTLACTHVHPSTTLHLCIHTSTFGVITFTYLYFFLIATFGCFSLCANIDFNSWFQSKILIFSIIVLHFILFHFSEKLTWGEGGGGGGWEGGGGGGWGC